MYLILATHVSSAPLSAQRVGVMSLEVTGEKLISGGDDSMIRIWNTNNWTCEQILRAHQVHLIYWIAQCRIIHYWVNRGACLSTLPFTTSSALFIFTDHKSVSYILHFCCLHVGWSLVIAHHWRRASDIRCVPSVSYLCLYPLVAQPQSGLTHANCYDKCTVLSAHSYSGCINLLSQYHLENLFPFQPLIIFAILKKRNPWMFERQSGTCFVYSSESCRLYSYCGS